MKEYIKNPIIGSIVKSNYRSKWIGVITNVGKEGENCSPNTCICTVRLIFTPSGALQKKGKTMTLSSGWLTEYSLSEKQLESAKKEGYL